MITKGRVLGAVLVLLFVAGLLAVFAPAMVVKAGPGAVASSIAGEVGPMLDGSISCDRFTVDVFRCIVSNDAAYRVRYEVEVAWTGCWDATPKAARPEGTPAAEALEGCINIWDL